jgi:DNA-binding NarL/FixJ family response regulator
MAAGLVPVIIKEARGELAAGLQPLLAGRPVRIVEVRSGADVLAALGDARGGVVVLDEGALSTEAVDLIIDLTGADPTVRILVLHNGGHADHLQAIFEAGAVYATRKPIGPDDLARIVGECLAGAVHSKMPRT